MSALPRITADGAKSALRVAVAGALARAAVTGFFQAEEEGRALTQLQQEDLLTMAIMVYHETVIAGEQQIDTEARLVGSPSPLTGSTS